MKKIYFWYLLILIVVALLPQGAKAQNRTQRETSTYVTSQQAMDVGYAYMHTGSGSKSGGTQSNAVRKQDMQLVYTGQAYDSLTGTTTDCYYVFALQPKGFVIVAADDRVEPILGYSYDNDFAVANMPVHVRGWLGNYERQIEAVAKSDIQPDPDTQTKWARLKGGQAMNSAKSGGSVGPLITTQWEQGWPFNDKCPVDTFGDRCMVGCVPVALGQIMKYHNWPSKGYGHVHYTQEDILDTISAVFDTTYYHWSQMPDGWTDTGYESMAQLLSDIGKSLFATYSKEATGANADIQTLADVFNYDFFSMQVINREHVDDSMWISLIKNELEDSRPVYYCGYNRPEQGTGHAFVCDGYDANGLFHFNFGWGGLCDGYYNLSNIYIVIDNFNYNQSVIIGMQPSAGTSISGNETLSGSLSFDESLYCGAFSNITIMPGTELKFAPGKGMCVSGSILAKGTVEEPILITASDTTQRWKGLQIHPSMICFKMLEEPDTLHINYTTISYSDNDGVNIGWPNYYCLPIPHEDIIQKGVVLNHVSIIHNEGRGLFGEIAQLTIDSSEIAQNKDWGILFDIGALTLSNSVLNNNNGCIHFHNQTELYNKPSIFYNNKIYNHYTNHTDNFNVLDLGFSGDGSLFSSNEIFNNTASQQIIWCYGAPISHNSFHDNVSYGDYGGCIITGGEIYSNTVCNNQGWAIQLTSGEIFNNLIYNNSGGIYSASGFGNDPLTRVYNNTIVNNNSGIFYGEYSSSGTFDIRNNVLWNGAENEIVAGNSSKLLAFNNIIKGGSENIIEDNPNSSVSLTCDKAPKFINPTTFIGPGTMPDTVSFELSLHSPAIDYGYYDSTMTIPEHDLAGNPRVNRSLDVGAYENQSDTIHPCFFTESNTVKSCVGLSVDLSMPYRGEQCSFAWYHNDSLISDSNSDTLHIETVASNDEGDYFCVISNTIGIDTSSLIHLSLSPQLPGCIEAINGSDTIYHFQQNISFWINNVLNADEIEWTVSEGLSIAKTSDTSVLVSVNQVVDSAYMYVIASNGCGVCADTAMIRFTVLPIPGQLRLHGDDWLITNCDFSWPNPTVKADNSFNYDEIEWQVPSWLDIQSWETGILHIVSSSYFDEDVDTLYARWLINGYGIGDWTPYIMHVFHSENYGSIVYVTEEGGGREDGSSWSNAIPDLSKGIQIASYLGKKLWVAKGTYYGDESSGSAFVLTRSIEMYGGFFGNEDSSFDIASRSLHDNVSVLDGQGKQSLINDGYYFGSQSSIIDGFLIQHAKGGGANLFYNWYGDDKNDTIRNCVFRYNEGEMASALYGGVAINCLFYENMSRPIYGSHILNSTVANNIGDVDVFSLNNSIVCDSYVWGDVNYSAVEDWDGGGEGNLILAHSNDGTSPDSNYVRFINPENGDFRLAYGSACINAGTLDISGLGLPTVDLQGLPRVLDGRIDMGAFEYYPVPEVETYDTICEGSSVTFYGTEYDTEGIYRVHTNPDPMQDTMYVLHLTVNYSTHNMLDTTVCESFTWIDGSGETYTVSDTYTYAYTNENGCASMDTLHLTVNVPTEGDTTAIVCGNFDWHGMHLTESGEYTRTLTNAARCDSIVTLYLTVNTSTEGDTTATVCGSFDWYGEHLTQSGDYYHTLANAAGCDSVVTLHLTINTATNGDTTAVVCESFDWYGMYLTQSGEYTHTLTNAAGCDSVVTLHLTINTPSEGDTTATVCESFDWYGAHLTQSGEYTHTLTNVVGCDSTVTLHLTVNVPTDGDTTAVVCEGFDWYGMHLTQSGDYYHTLTNVAGCDSTVTLHLTVNVPTEGDTTAVVCESFDWYGMHLTQSGEYTDILTNAAGCDSIVTLHLTVNVPTEGDTTAVVCESFDWYGMHLAQSGDYYHTLTNAAGCDSVVTLHLTINIATYGDTTATVCESLDWYGMHLTQSGDYTHTLTNVAGCDSVVTLHLTVNTPSEGDTTAVVCGSFDWHGYTNLTQSGDYIDVLTNATGCDSTVTLHLTVNVPTQGDTTATVCGSFDWYGAYLTQSGEYTNTLTNAAGCDSVVTLHLTVNTATVGDTTATVCESFDWYGTHLTQSGEYTHTMTNAAGCDGIVTLYLTVNTPTEGDTTATVCGSFDWYGAHLTQSGDYTHTFTNAVGCDSVVTLHLTVNNPTEGDTTATVCGSFDWYGLHLTESGDYTHTLTNVAGCDSIVTLHLTINTPTEGDTTATICGSFDWYGMHFIQSGEYTHTLTNAAGCDSILTLHLTVNQPTTGTDVQTACGSYTWIDGVTYTESNSTATYTLTNAVGCDSVVTINLTINQLVTSTSTATICDSELPYEWNGLTFNEAGTQSLTLQTVNGCDSTVEMTLTVNPSVTIEASLTISENDLPFTYGDTTFMPGTVQSGDYTFHFTTADGCDSIIILHLTVETGISSYDLSANMKVYPNPTSGVLNVELTTNNVQFGDVKIQIYDVYGKLLDNVETQNIASPHTTQIDLSRYSSGIYFIKAVDGDRQLGMRKIVKQ